jgi:hypothetical protein
MAFLAFHTLFGYCARSSFGPANVITEPVLRAAATAVFPCVIVDLFIRFILIRLRREAGVVYPGAWGTAGWFLSTVAGNTLTCGAFAFAYLAVWGGMDRAFLFGGAVWLTIVVPVLLMGRYLEHERKQILIAKVFGWLAKASVVSASCSIFIG